MGSVCRSIPSGYEDKDVPWQKAWRSDHGAENPVNRDDIKEGRQDQQKQQPTSPLVLIIPHNSPLLPRYCAAERGIPNNLFSLDFSPIWAFPNGINWLPCAIRHILRQCRLCERIAKRQMADLISNKPAPFEP